jgi:murein L,D-transpeptidase YcbB/YkuD
VNIPDYRLYAYEGGEPVLQMRVVVGDEYENATPVFADSMTSVVFRPYWYVPPRIVVDELIPRVRKKRSYLARHHYEVLDASPESRVLNPRRINWSRVDPRTIRVRQKPGSTNHLGLVKFIFPNQFAVYLHDSPLRNQFARARRTSSHGCVWLEKPVELAEYVLAGQDDWDRKRIEDAMAGTQPVGDGKSGDGRAVALAQPVPVYLVYLTALVQDGVLNFRPDPYDKDRKPMAALGKLVPTDPALCEELQKLLEG